MCGCVCFTIRLGAYENTTPRALRLRQVLFVCVLASARARLRCTSICTQTTYKLCTVHNYYLLPATNSRHPFVYRPPRFAFECPLRSVVLLRVSVLGRGTRRASLASQKVYRLPITNIYTRKVREGDEQKKTPSSQNQISHS